MKNFDSWDTYEGFSEGSGRSEKIWLISGDQKIGLFKYPKIDPVTGNVTSEHISEHLAYKIGNILGVKTAEVEIGTRNGRIGCMSYCINNPHQSIIEGINFITRIYPSYDANKMMDLNTGVYYNINYIINSTKVIVPISVWLEMMLFDFLIGNTDRHQGNWAVLVEFINRDKGFIAERCPLYDNGSSLCSYINDSMIPKMLGRDPGPLRALIDTKSRSRIRIEGATKAEPSHRKMLNFLLKSYEETASIAVSFLSRLNSNNIVDLLADYEPNMLSKDKKVLITKFLLGKLEILEQELNDVR